MYLDSGEHYHNDTSYAFVLKNPDSNLYKTYLAILNSPIIWFYLKETGTSLRGGYFRFKTKYLENFPLPSITPEQQQTLAALADQMLAAHTQLASAKSDADKKRSSSASPFWMRKSMRRSMPSTAFPPKKSPSWKAHKPISGAASLRPSRHCEAR